MARNEIIENPATLHKPPVEFPETGEFDGEGQGTLLTGPTILKSNWLEQILVLDPLEDLARAREILNPEELLWFPERREQLRKALDWVTEQTLRASLYANLPPELQGRWFPKKRKAIKKFIDKQAERILPANLYTKFSAELNKKKDQVLTKEDVWKYLGSKFPRLYYGHRERIPPQGRTSAESRNRLNEEAEQQVNFVIAKLLRPGTREYDIWEKWYNYPGIGTAMNYFVMAVGLVGNRQEDLQIHEKMTKRKITADGGGFGLYQKERYKEKGKDKKNPFFHALNECSQSPDGKYDQTTQAAFTIVWFLTGMQDLAVKRFVAVAASIREKDTEDKLIFNDYKRALNQAGVPLVPYPQEGKPNNFCVNIEKNGTILQVDLQNVLTASFLDKLYALQSKEQLLQIVEELRKEITFQMRYKTPYDLNPSDVEGAYSSRSKSSHTALYEAALNISFRDVKEGAQPPELVGDPGILINPTGNSEEAAVVAVALYADPETGKIHTQATKNNHTFLDGKPAEDLIKHRGSRSENLQKLIQQIGLGEVNNQANNRIQFEKNPFWPEQLHAAAPERVLWVAPIRRGHREVWKRALEAVNQELGWDKQQSLTYNQMLSLSLEILTSYISGDTPVMHWLEETGRAVIQPTTGLVNDALVKQVWKSIYQREMPNPEESVKLRGYLIECLDLLRGERLRASRFDLTLSAALALATGRFDDLVAILGMITDRKRGKLASRFGKLASYSRLSIPFIGAGADHYRAGNYASGNDEKGDILQSMRMTALQEKQFKQRFQLLTNLPYSPENVRQFIEYITSELIRILKDVPQDNQ